MIKIKNVDGLIICRIAVLNFGVHQGTKLGKIYLLA